MGEEQLANLRDKDNIEKEPAIELRREYTNLGSDLGERNEHVASHISALALAMTDEACQEAQM